MSTESPRRQDLEQRIEAIESGYEFLLAYAAQGRTTDKSPGAGREVRGFLSGMAAGLSGLGGVVAACLEERDAEVAAAARAFVDAVAADAAIAEGAIRLVLAQPDISSQIVDNLNASIHVRAVLTDLFVVDEALGGGPAR